MRVTKRKTKEQLRAVFLAALMIGSVVGGSVAFVGQAAAGPSGDSVKNLDTGFEFATIQAAINNASTDAGDKIVAQEAGTYDPFVINKSVVVEATADATIDANGIQQGVDIEANDSALKNFEIVGDSGTATGVAIDGGLSNVTVSGNEIHGMAGDDVGVADVVYGIHHFGGTVSDLDISGNTLYDIGSTDASAETQVISVGPTDGSAGESFISNNQIYNIISNDTTNDGSLPAESGIVLLNSGAITVNGNDISDVRDWGIAHLENGGGGEVTITSNTIDRPAIILGDSGALGSFDESGNYQFGASDGFGTINGVSTGTTEKASTVLGDNNVRLVNLDGDTERFFVELNPSEVIHGDTVELQGTITDGFGNLADSQTINYEVQYVNDTGAVQVLADDTTNNGEFIATQTFDNVDNDGDATDTRKDYPTEGSPSDDPRYRVVVSANETDTNSQMTDPEGSATVNVRLSLSNFSTSPSPVVYNTSGDVSGKFTDASGTGVDGYTIELFEPDNDQRDDAETAATGEFGFTAVFDDAGPWELATNEGGKIVYKTINVRPQTATVNISSSDARVNFDSSFTVTAEKPNGAPLDTDSDDNDGEGTDGFVYVEGPFEAESVDTSQPDVIATEEGAFPGLDADNKIDFIWLDTGSDGQATFTATPLDETQDARLDNFDSLALSFYGGVEVEDDAADTPSSPDYVGSDSNTIGFPDQVNIVDYQILDGETANPDSADADAEPAVDPGSDDILADGAGPAGNGPDVVEVLPLQGTDAGDVRVESETRLGKDTFSSLSGLTQYTVWFEVRDENADPIDPANLSQIQLTGPGINATVTYDSLTDSFVISSANGNVLDVYYGAGAKYGILVRPTEVTSPDENFSFTFEDADGNSAGKNTPTDGLQIASFSPTGPVDGNSVIDVSATVETPDDVPVNNGRVRVAQLRYNSTSAAVEAVPLGDKDARQSSVNVNNGTYNFENLSVGPRGIDTDSDGIGDRPSQLTFTAYQYKDTDDNGVADLENNEVNRATVETLGLAVAQNLNVTYLPANTSEYSGFSDGTFTLTRGVEYDQIAFRLTQDGTPVNLTKGIGGQEVGLNQLVAEDLINLNAVTGLSSTSLNVTFDTSASRPGDGFYVIDDIEDDSSALVDSSGSTFVFDTSGLGEPPNRYTLDITTANLSRTNPSGDGVFQSANAQIESTIFGVAGSNVPNSTDDPGTLAHDQTDEFNTSRSIETPTAGINRAYRVNATAKSALGKRLNGSAISEVVVTYVGPVEAGDTATVTMVDGPGVTVPGPSGSSDDVGIDNANGTFQFDLEPTDAGADGSLELTFDVEAQNDVSTAPIGQTTIFVPPQAKLPRVEVYSENGGDLPVASDTGNQLLALGERNRLRVEAFPNDQDDFPLPDGQSFTFEGPIKGGNPTTTTQSLDSYTDTELATPGYDTGQLGFVIVEPTGTGDGIIDLTSGGAPVTDLSSSPIKFDVQRTNRQQVISLTPDTPIAGENLTITITDDTTGAPVDESVINIEVPNGSTETFTTNDNGNLTLSGGFLTESGKYSLTARRAGYSTATTSFDLAEEAFFEVSSLSAPANVTAGQNVTVTATVTNTGGVEASETVEFRIAGSTLKTEEVTLAGGASTTVTFEVDSSPLAPAGTTPPNTPASATYTHGVFTTDDNSTAQITVETDASASVSDQSYDGNVTEVVVDSYDLGVNGENVSVWMIQNGTPQMLLGAVEPNASNGTDLVIPLDKELSKNTTVIVGIHTGAASQTDNLLATSGPAQLTVEPFGLANAETTVDEANDTVTLSYDVKGTDLVGTFYKIFPANPPEYQAEPGFFSGPNENNPETVTRTVPLSGGAVDADGNGLMEGERYVFEAYVNNKDGTGFQTILSRFTTPSGPLAVELAGSAVNDSAVTLTANVTGFNGTDTVGSYYAYREDGTSGSTFVSGPSWDLPDQDKTTTITGLQANTTYVFTITVNNGAGDSVKKTVKVTTASS